MVIAILESITYKCSSSIFFHMTYRKVTQISMCTIKTGIYVCVGDIHGIGRCYLLSIEKNTLASISYRK